MEAVKESSYALEYASNKLMLDREFFLKVIKQNYHALRYANDELIADKSFMIEAIKINPLCLQSIYLKKYIKVNR